MTERTATDYAIEFGEYLAKAAERYLAARDRLLMLQGEGELAPDPDTLAAAEESESDHASGVRGAVYEFRKRAERAKATPPEERANETAEEACRRLGWWIQEQCDPGPYNVKGWFPSKAMTAFLEGFEAGQATRSPRGLCAVAAKDTDAS